MCRHYSQGYILESVSVICDTYNLLFHAGSVEMRTSPHGFVTNVETSEERERITEEAGVNTQEIPNEWSMLRIALKRRYKDTTAELRSWSAVVTPLLRCLGNVCSGPDDACLLAWTNPGLLQAFESYLSSTHRHIRKETLWVLSNITGEDTICQDVTFSSLVPSVQEQLKAAYDIKTEALYFLCNLACHGERVCEQLLHVGCLQQVIPILKTSDAELLSLALAFCEMILRLTQAGKEVFEQSDGVARLEGLEYHANPTIQQQANDLLDGYFLIDEGEES
ncbi:hypothetical protein ScPMuIL_000949 [Solemya velum]